MKKIGILQRGGFVVTEDGKKYILPIRGIDKLGYPEVLIDARNVGGDSEAKRQSIRNYIGMKVEFIARTDIGGYNFRILE
jgi:hypothetical protein